MGEKNIAQAMFFFSWTSFFIQNIIHKKYFESILQYKLVCKSLSQTCTV